VPDFGAAPVGGEDAGGASGLDAAVAQQHLAVRQYSQPAAGGPDQVTAGEGSGGPAAGLDRISARFGDGQADDLKSRLVTDHDSWSAHPGQRPAPQSRPW
jgi:hypothetical protein